MRYWDGTRWTEHVAPTPPRAPAQPTPPAHVGSDGRPTSGPGRAAWLGWGGLALTASLGAASSGFSGFLALGGLYVLVVAVIALVRGHVDWARLHGRAAGGLAVGAAIALFMAGGATASPTDATPVAAPTATSTPSPSATATATVTVTATPTPTTTAPTPTASPTTTAPSPETARRGTALAAVATLTVKGRAPRTGYDRGEFGQAWFDTDRNGCDTRNDVLRRDLVSRDMKNSCKVLAGTLRPDPYTGADIRFEQGGTSEVDVDHVVSLSDAWQKGAATWKPQKRLAFANDPVNLLAVDAGANRAKGDGDTATWLPPNKSYRCAYVARQVAVKAKYEVWVTRAEREAMVRVLSACPSLRLPAAGPAPTTAALPKSTPRPTTAAPKPPAPAPPPEAPSYVYYKNCDAARAAGAAPVRRGDPGYASHLDRDGDGVGCE